MESIFDRYGGQAFWDTVLDEFYQLNLEDPELLSFFQGKDVNRIKEMYRCLLRAALREAGEHFPVSIKRVHKDMPITSFAFDKFTQNLQTVISRNGVNDEDKEEIILVIMAFKEDIVKH